MPQRDSGDGRCDAFKAGAAPTDGRVAGKAGFATRLPARSRNRVRPEPARVVRWTVWG